MNLITQAVNKTYNKIKDCLNLDVNPNQTTTDVTGLDLSALWYVDNTKPLIEYTFFKKVKFLKAISVLDTSAERNQIINSFNSKLIKRYNDHRNILIDEKFPSKFFEPQQVAKTDNLVVINGLTKLAQIITNQSTTFFTFIEVGESANPVGPLNDKLVLPVYRTNVSDLGWFEPHGNSVRTGTLFPQDVRSCTIREIGCFDLATDPSVMLWRVVITDSNKYLTHTQGSTYFSISHVNLFKGK